MQVIRARDIDDLIEALRRRAFTVVGPTVRDGAIVYDELDSMADLPAGMTDEQAPGHYRLKKRTDGALFGYVVGPQSWKRFLFPPRELLWQLRRTPDGFASGGTSGTTDERYAFLGVRSCELHAIARQDRVFLGGQHTDPLYAARRHNAFVIVVQCAEARSTCFCTSMNTGPRAQGGFDLALTERISERNPEPNPDAPSHPLAAASADADGDLGDYRHEFLVEVGSDAGQAVLDELQHRQATREDRDAAMRQSDAVAASIRAANRAFIGAESADAHVSGGERARQILRENPEHPHWQDVAQRCLTCANCTMVCPTCFCHTIEDTTDLSGDHAERWRRWDSCFSQEFAYIHGGTARASAPARYRQWLTHKLSSWFEQFDSSGCVGCGRCITWCPVGIDLRQEVHAIASAPTEKAES